MKQLYDYFYRFPDDQLRMRGRCRVRIYARNNGHHTVVLTELNSNSGESINSACERIATHIVAIRGLNPRTTRWIQHDLPHADHPQLFEELHFTWDANNLASDPQWQHLQNEQAEALTGDLLSTLNRRLGDLELENEGTVAHEPT